ncbi:hypothetical protein DFP94_11470 [Fontibacillus phaseoli]|uniref:Uncharacterized protein n=1 Tax=Fontibacillus phaseoli TaxID=1416533 RepID=A0A369B1T2_9BACL|nr:DUF6615 family protein [Fontibacillus phaseoli]RCX15622.1 hypothetical protein DFP94_11470 [Fontibacillus phaseoli]
MYKTTIDLFEKLAIDTWERLKYGEELNCSQSEETITDINLLEIKRANLHDILVSKSDKYEEGITGIDWEWWIGSNSTGWWRYAVQAKKLSENRKYNKLRHRVGQEYQIDILERYSKSNNCIPLYCFYNYIDDNMLNKNWHCYLPFEKEQLGCTVVPLDSVRKAFTLRADKSFSALHSDFRSIPWRCLVRCPDFLVDINKNSSHPLASIGYEKVRPYKINLSNVTSESILNSEFYNHEIEILPKRIMIIQTEDH